MMMMVVSAIAVVLRTTQKPLEAHELGLALDDFI